jgi:cell division protein FtsI (penicillin-binding protein 3)
MTRPRPPRPAPRPRPPVRQALPARGAPARRPPARRLPRRLRLRGSSRRLSFGLSIVCALLLLVGGRLVQLQGVDSGGYARAAAAEKLMTTTLHASRGEIVDRNGVVLAYTGDAKDIVADPSQIAPHMRLEYAMRLAPLVGQPVNVVATQLSKGGRYALLGRGVAPGKAAQISDLLNSMGLRGIYVQATTQRLYPGGSIAANVVGLVHSDGAGAAGIEQQYNTLLSGKDGSTTYELDGNGNVNPAGYSRTVAPMNGGTVTLTISQDLQFVVQHELDQMVNASGARRGQVCVMDRYGNVLALAQNDTFNAQDPSSITASTQLDAPIQLPYEPGSVNKVVAFSAALQKGRITPRTVVKVPDQLNTGGILMHDAWYHPTQRMTATGIIAESSNIGALKVAHKVGGTAWYDMARALGLGQRTGIELPGESAGVLPPMSNWSASTFANLPIGQGVSMTVLQMTSMYQTIANGGVRIPPRIVSSTTTPDGSVRTTPRPTGVRAMSEKTATTLRTMLESVMMPNGGTGTKAAIPGYRIAGKTGTAQQPDPHTGRYSNSVYWDTFAGMAPADDPQFVVGIVIDAPAHGVHGGDVAAPLFHDIAAYELQHEGIPPSGTHTKVVPFVVGR